MTIVIKALGGIKASAIMLATTFGSILIATQIATAPPAQACAGLTDPITGVCWTGSSEGSGVSGTGGTCLPGRLGLCLAGLANSEIAGDTLPSNNRVNAQTNTGSSSWP